MAEAANDPGIRIEPAWKVSIVYGMPCAIYHQLPAAYSLAAPIGTCVIGLFAQWHGALHSSRLVDQVGLHWFQTIQTGGLLSQNPSPLLASGQPRASGSLEQFAHAVQLQTSVLTIAATFLVMAGLCVVSALIVLLLPVRTLPPRIQFARH